MQSERESCCGIISTTSRLIICESAFKNCTSAAVKNDLDSWSSCDNKWRADQSIQRSQNTRCLLPIRWINSCRDLWWHGYDLSTQFNSSLSKFLYVYCLLLSNRTGANLQRWRREPHRTGLLSADWRGVPWQRFITNVSRPFFPFFLLSHFHIRNNLTLDVESTSVTNNVTNVSLTRP